jgi:hypothetical protein
MRADAVSTDHRAKLKNIRDFRSLIPYLRDEMDWPIEQDSLVDVDDLFFDFTPEELGVDPRNAAKIRSVRQLRPLRAGQPFGIFFVHFEPKRLPVVALRRILGHVVVKRRASSNKADRAAWHAGDLLFVSNYGEGEGRQISFAHFAESADGGDLPTLKVLGWDNLDTALHIDDVAKQLTEQLAWPNDETNLAEWRRRWSSAFTVGVREPVKTSRELSIRLAELARAIRDRIRTALAIETARGPLTKLMTAFQEALVHDLDADGFADMYAQTIAYGLLSARIADPHRKTADDFAAHMRTNPFLRELMETFLKVGGRRGKAGGPGIDFDELGVSEVVDLLDDANMEAVVRDFGDRNPQEDPVIHFYQDFLQQYDAKKRMQRGVFYTPRPVVSYIVRSVDELLRTEFGLEDGLADTTTWGEMAKRHEDMKIPEGVSPEQDFIQILDPATGTGTFLVEVIDLIHKTLVARWKTQGYGEKKIDALWNEYVPKHLLTRVHGYELLMAPYAIAHLKVGLKLYETGYRFGSAERARIYLTNSLEPPGAVGQLRLEGILPALAHEATEVSEIKRSQHFTVLLGNPPYFGAASRGGEWIASLMRGRDILSGETTENYFESGGQPLEERTIKWLNDDYVKFMRLSEWLIDRSAVGVMGLVTNHSYLDNPTFRGMRESLLCSFQCVRVLDLHGNANKKEAAPDGSPDKNVFDIMQGVAVCLMSKRWKVDGVPRLRHADLWGEREDKYAALEHASAVGDWVPLTAAPPNFLFVPEDEHLRAEYSAWWSIADVFPVNGVGMTTARDYVVIDFDKAPLLERATLFRDSRASDADLCEKLGIPLKKGWDIRRARALIRQEKALGQYIRPMLYRPFDVRLIFYHDSLVWRTVKAVMRHMLSGKNLGIITTRQTKDDWGALATRHIIGHKTCAAYDVNSLFPLYVLAEPVTSLFGDGVRGPSGTAPIPNLDERFLAQFSERLGMELRSGEVPSNNCYEPEDVLAYAYAVFHSPNYRSKYEAFLKADFPRIPLPSNRDVFDALVKLGGRLVEIHTLESCGLEANAPEYSGPARPIIQSVKYAQGTVWLNREETAGFTGVSEESWGFIVGGYQVCEKWLKDRKGRTLSKNDIAHYQKIVVALAETIRLMKEIDEVIERHGGWPGAFGQGIPSSDADGASHGDAGAGAARASGQEALVMDDSEPESACPEPKAGRTISIDDLDAQELICAVRQLFSDGTVRDRDSAIGDLAGQVGLTRVGSRIRESLDNAIRTAVRRGILENNGNGLRIQARSLEDYDRAFLKEQFLASLQGKAWTERDDAVQGFARWMGFRRTGSTIAETARSLINGIIREERLESDGSRIRRVG